MARLPVERGSVSSTSTLALPARDDYWNSQSNNSFRQRKVSPSRGPDGEPVRDKEL